MIRRARRSARRFRWPRRHAWPHGHAARGVAALRHFDLDHVGADAKVSEAQLLPIIGGEAERWLGKPVLAINAAALWPALRTNGIPDQIRGFGSLLREH